eukprot:CAMPEP_0113487574 /NCGR_PEP_ID=MMETSP0014_2-20120614/25577_1 /TAXON_ID=2857 /ORGANISM="Nitzschia sp." /LENGTH=640 /DNA_ID=CAMNT_0000381271 /DNA_START=217 /DNA_END=2139 /DNA_ORIENTATION=- /assembly_acc=CAM_ASM_000159
MNFLRQQSAKFNTGGSWGLKKDGNKDDGSNDTMTDEQAELEEAMKSIEEAHGAETTNNKKVVDKTTAADGSSGNDASSDPDKTHPEEDDKAGKSGKQIAMEWFQTMGDSLRDVKLGDGDTSENGEGEGAVGDKKDVKDGDGDAGVAKAAAGYFASVSSYFHKGGNNKGAASSSSHDDSHSTFNNSSSAIPKFSFSGGASVMSMTSHDSQGDPEFLHVQNEVKVARAKLKTLRDDNRQMTKKHRGDLASWQQRKASKGREIWMKRQYAKNFGLALYKDILMDCSEASDEHDSSPKTLNAEASLLRAQHNEKMTENLMTMVHTHQQELIDHFYTDLLPKMKEERDQVRPDGEVIVEAQTKANDDLKELYEKIVELQTSIMEKYREHLPEEEKAIDECDEFAEEDGDEKEAEKNSTSEDKVMVDENEEEDDDDDEDELVERGGKKKEKIPPESADAVEVKDEMDDDTKETAEDGSPTEVPVEDKSDASVPKEDEKPDQPIEVDEDTHEAEDNEDTEPEQPAESSNGEDSSAEKPEAKKASPTPAAAGANRPGGVSSRLTRPTAASTASRTNVARRPLPSAAGAGKGGTTRLSAAAGAAARTSAASRPLPSRPVNGSASRPGAGGAAKGLTAEQRAKIRSELRK